MIPQPDPRDLARHVDELDGELTETAAIRCTLPDGTPILVRFLEAGEFVVACDPELYEAARQHVHRACRLNDITLTALFEHAAAEARQASRRYWGRDQVETVDDQPRTRRGLARG